MEEGLRAYILFSLFVSSAAWPRYGRPHPLYNGRLQTNENLFANAVLLGLDFNDLRSLQAASGNNFGLGNLGLPNNGFPMNAYERKRARQDVNTLTALGVIDGPEEAGPYGSLVRSNKPDPPDNPGGRDGGGKNKKKSGKKNKVKRKSKVADKSKQVTVNAKVQQDTPHNKVIKTTVPKQKLATKVVKATPQKWWTGAVKVNNRKGLKGGVKVTKKRKTKRKGGNRGGEGGDPGEGRLAEQGEMRLKARGKRVLWRSTGGEDAQIGRGEVLDRRVFVGGF